LYGQVEVARILREIVRSLLFCGRDITRAWETEAGKSCITRRSEEAERVPPVPPRVPDLLIGIENQERNAAPGEVISHREAGLAAPDDDRVNWLQFELSVHFDFLHQEFR
jgi:hypothetical protein